MTHSSYYSILTCKTLFGKRDDSKLTTGARLSWIKEVFPRGKLLQKCFSGGEESSRNRDGPAPDSFVTPEEMSRTSPDILSRQRLRIGTFDI